MSGRTLIVGLGSDVGDDRAGHFAAQRLEQELGLAAVRSLRSPAGLLDHFDGVDELHVIDACRGWGEKGAIFRAEWPAPTVAALCFTGTHDFDLVAALRLADELGIRPQRVTIWGIEAGDAAERSPHAPLSEDIAAAIERLVALVSTELRTEAPHA